MRPLQPFRNTDDLAVTTHWPDRSGYHSCPPAACTGHSGEAGGERVALLV